jgi:uncharacterized protein with HEPN domain
MTEPRDHDTVIDDMIDHIDYVLVLANYRLATSAPTATSGRASSARWISEASRRLPAELQNIRSEIPWRQVVDFGNILRHTYYSVSANIVWRIATEDLIPLREALTAMRGRRRDR